MTAKLHSTEKTHILVKKQTLELYPRGRKQIKFFKKFYQTASSATKQ